MADQNENKMLQKTSLDEPLTIKGLTAPEVPGAPAVQPATPPQSEGILENIQNPNDPKVQIQLEKSAPSGPEKKSILGAMPTMPKFGQVNQINKAEYERELKISKWSLGGAIGLAVLTFAFFYIQLHPTLPIFGPNITQRHEEVKKETANVRADVLVTRALTARILLDEVSVETDNYFSSSKASNAKTKIQQLLAEAQTLMPDSIDDDVEENMLEILRAKKQAVHGAAEDEDNKKPEEAQSIQNTIRMVQNNALKSLIRNFNPQNPEPEISFDDMLQQLRESDQNELSIIAKLQGQRVKWREIIAEIEKITKDVDHVFDEGLFEQIGGIVYSGYSFDAANGKISVTGRTKTMDSRTFTLIANLIDAFEKSPKFKNVDKRSFSKSKGDDGFSTTLKLDFELETTNDAL